MKTTWNYSRRLLPFFLCMLLSVFGNNAQTLPFRLSKGAGTFRLGVVCGNESCWLDQCSVKKKGQAYTIKDKLWKEGEIKLIVCPLTNSNGFIMEVSGERLPEELKLCWAFGACDGADDSAVTDNSIPAASCFHNVFSTEGNAFTTYYGESMKLRTVVPKFVCPTDINKHPRLLYSTPVKRQMPPSSLPYTRGNRKKNSTSV